MLMANDVKAIPSPRYLKQCTFISSSPEALGQLRLWLSSNDPLKINPIGFICRLAPVVQLWFIA
jgi:hypothetical protein